MVAWSLQTRRRMLLFLNVVLLAGIVGLLYGSVTTSPSPREPAFQPDETKRPSPEKKKRKAQTLSFYLAAARVPLRRPLVEPPSPPKPLSKKPVVRDSSLRTQLIGTIIDAEHSYGVFINAAGEEIPLAVGETIDKARLMRVDRLSVTLKYCNKMVLLELPREEEFFK